jgi:hypothetical protein
LSPLAFLGQQPESTLAELFAADPARAEDFAHDLGGIRFDLSKTHLTREAIASLDPVIYHDALARLFAGEVVNSTERPSIRPSAVLVRPTRSRSPPSVTAGCARWWTRSKPARSAT